MNVSVAMATYNGQDFLIEQIDSIINQLGAQDELVISDDGSTDNTIEIINHYLKDDRVKLYKNPDRGVIKNFENAINKTQNEIIILSDQDDVWLPNKVKYIKNEFNDNKSKLIVTSAKRVNSDLEEFEIDSIYNRSWQKGVIRNFVKNTYIGCCMAFDRTLLDKILPFPSNIPMHDVWIGLLAELNEIEIKYIEEPLILYRRHGNTATNNHRSKFKKIVYWRVNLFINLFRRIRKLQGGS
ncbi:glycosyltransferase [Paenisporosarcina quisquiliarum]|uniref:glycosyltransferase n=1 Tax=Paenisporosarcina quisquiliarum TaxID=365346 RepID=UPI003735AD16